MNTKQTPSKQYWDDERETIIERCSGWRSLDVNELWAYRELLWVLVSRDIKVRYKQTIMGASWALIQPLATMFLFSLVFGRLVKVSSDGFPYPIFVFAGLLPWSFFSGAISRSGGSIIGQQQLISKVYFPRLIIPISSVGAGLLDFAISFLIMLGLMLYFGVGWSIQLLALPLLLLAVVFIALGVGILLSALVVTYRDFGHVIPFLVQFWMFATPVIYPASVFPEKWQWVLNLNPMSGLIGGFRSAFLGRSFDYWGVSISMLSAVVIFLIGVFYFERMERRFADII